MRTLRVRSKFLLLTMIPLGTSLIGQLPDIKTCLLLLHVTVSIDVTAMSQPSYML